MQLFNFFIDFLILPSLEVIFKKNVLTKGFHVFINVQLYFFLSKFSLLF